MYKRIVLKLSGEALAGPRGFGLDADKVAEITAELAEVHDLGVEIGVVVGGGNFFRGVQEQAKEMDRVAPTTWACSRRSSTPLLCRTRLNSAKCSAA